nr:hypothetical protein [Tanacetum cinerariifolium]
MFEGNHSAEEDQLAEDAVIPKFDMSCYESSMSPKDVKSLALRYGIPLDLHPCASSVGWTMNQLPEEVIGLYEQFLTLGWHLEEIHVTWAHLEKKQTRLRLYTRNHQETYTERGDGVAIIKRRRQDLQCEGVRDPTMASGRGLLK